MRRADRAEELPELELLGFDAADDPDGDERVDDGASPARGGRIGAVIVAGVAAVLLAGGLAATDRPDPAVEVLPTPPTTVATPTATTPARRGPSTVMTAGDGDGVFVSSDRWEGVVPLDPALGEVTSVASGRGFYVVTFANGEARRYDRRGDVVGDRLGPAELVLDGAGNRRVVWLVVREGDAQIVSAVAEDGPSTGWHQVPAGWRVAGTTGAGFVLRRAAGEGVALWNHEDGSDPNVLDERGQFVASDRWRIAWARDELLVQAEEAPGVSSRLQLVLEGTVTAGRYSPDGSRLALLLRTGDDTRWMVHVASHGEGVVHGFVATSSTTPTIGWSVQGELLVEPGSAGEHRYDPESGLVTRRPPNGFDGT